MVYVKIFVKTFQDFYGAAKTNVLSQNEAIYGESKRSLGVDMFGLNLFLLVSSNALNYKIKCTMNNLSRYIMFAYGVITRVHKYRNRKTSSNSGKKVFKKKWIKNKLV